MAIFLIINIFFRRGDTQRDRERGRRGGQNPISINVGDEEEDLYKNNL